MEKMYFVIFMITCTVFEATVNGCPSSCTCTNTDVSCGERSLTTVPLDIPTSTRTLGLSSNQIETLDENIFNGLTALEYLWLQSNEIVTLDVNLFKGLTALKTLYLEDNKIATLDVNLFKGLTALEKLHLQNNRIVTLDVNVFNDLTALMELKLENNPLNCSMCMMKKFKDFLQRNNDFGNSGARCEGEANLLIDQSFDNCKGIKPCDGLNCQNGGSCDSSVSPACCICVGNYFGDRCENINGGWTEWSVWSDCPDTCGDEDLTRTRSCTNPAPENNGTVCQGHTSETISCTTAKCPVNGGWTEWSVWSDCPETCGDEYLTRTRSCTNPSPENNGTDCQGSNTETLLCSTAQCPVNGGWTEWSVWSDCPETCSDEDLIRTRSCTNPSPDNNGTACQGNTTETISCSTAKCPVNGKWTAWSVWSDCPETCGDEDLIRTRSCTNPSPGNNGTVCQGNTTETISCHTANCPDSFSPPETECTTGIMNAVVIILVSCGAGILPFFCIVYCCAHKKGKRANINRNVNNHGNNADRDEEISRNVLTEKESDEEYAEIDELEVSDLIVSPLEQRCFTDSDSSSDNASDEIKLSSFGYSHPIVLHRDEEIRQDVLTEKESDEEYAEIDELELSDLIVSPLEQRCFTDSDSSSDYASDEIKQSSFGYSHPTLLPAPQQSGNVQGDSDAC